MPLAPQGFSPSDFSVGPAAMVTGPQAATGAVTAFRKLFELLGSRMRGPQPGGELAGLLKGLGGTVGPKFRPAARQATARIGRGPIGRPDLPSEELMSSLESPGGRPFSSLRQPSEYYRSP